MKASKIYNDITARVDDLQNSIETSKRTLEELQTELEIKQQRMRQIMDLIIERGDHELTEEELIELGIQ